MLPHFLALVAEGKVRKRATWCTSTRTTTRACHQIGTTRTKSTTAAGAHDINNFLFAGLLEAVEHVIFVERRGRGSA